MADIVLATLNARYAHTALGLRCLKANLGPWRDRSQILEFVVGDHPRDVAEALLAQGPRLVGLGVYIWNVAPLTEVVGILKAVRPDLPLVLGGPEMADPQDLPDLARWADYRVSGEGEQSFREIVEGVLGSGAPALGEPIHPWALYDAQDLAHRVTYVETSRGCPFRCAFCLSAGTGVRSLPWPQVQEGLEDLWERGARRFKFVDRTFNLGESGERVLRWFLPRASEGVSLHFEVVPHPFPQDLLPVLEAFPPGAVQLEVGIQTWDPQVGARIGRPQDPARVEETLRTLRTRTGVHLHTDLVVGLPGEDLRSFAAGFDRLVALQPQEIQVGVLKRLRGTPLARRAREWGLAFNPSPPHDVIRTPDLDYGTLQEIKRFSLLWDRAGNSGAFRESLPLLWERGSPFQAFSSFSRRVHGVEGRNHGIALPRLAALLLEELVDAGVGRERALAALARDWVRVDPRHVPGFLQAVAPPAGSAEGGLLKRQGRHQR